MALKTQKAFGSSTPGIPPMLIPNNPVKKPSGKNIADITESTYMFLFNLPARIFPPPLVSNRYIRYFCVHKKGS
jgi:hypothetical protein